MNDEIQNGAIKRRTRRDGWSRNVTEDVDADRHGSRGEKRARRGNNSGSSSKSSNSSGKAKEPETDPVVLERRQKQIDCKLIYSNEAGREASVA